MTEGFPTDNNGVIVELPAISSSGQDNVSGSLVFGIGTQSNNALGSATVFPLDGYGNLTTIYNGTGYPGFMDSGSNALFFLDSSTTGLQTCTDSAGFYCTNQSYSGTTVQNQGYNSVSTEGVSFAVESSDSLGNFTALNDLAGPMSGYWDWGLPFFFGRNVYTAIAGQNNPAGVIPFFAY